MHEVVVTKAVYRRDEANNYEALAFAGPDGELVLDVQLALAFDDQDIELGQATYCLVGPNGETTYGGMLYYGVAGRIAVIAVDQPTGAIFAVDGGWRFTLAGGVDRRLVEDRLDALFAELEFDDPDAEPEPEPNWTVVSRDRFLYVYSDPEREIEVRVERVPPDAIFIDGMAVVSGSTSLDWDVIEQRVIAGLRADGYTKVNGE